MIPWAIALVLFAAIMTSVLRSQMVTGGFQQTGPSAMLVLVNASSLSDSALADISVSLDRRFANVEVALRLSGQQCRQGEWCVIVTDAMLGRSPNPGAVVGQEVTREILRKLVG